MYIYIRQGGESHNKKIVIHALFRLEITADIELHQSIRHKRIYHSDMNPGVKIFRPIAVTIFYMYKGKTDVWDNNMGQRNRSQAQERIHTVRHPAEKQFRWVYDDN